MIDKYAFVVRGSLRSYRFDLRLINNRGTGAPMGLVNVS